MTRKRLEKRRKAARIGIRGKIVHEKLKDQISTKSFSSSRWFKLEANPLTKQDDFVFAGGFWDRNYDNLDLDLF